MKILITLHDLAQYGGVQSWVWTMAHELGEHHQVDVFCHVGGPMSKEIQQLGTGYLYEKDLPPDNYDLILVNHNTTARFFIDYDAVSIYTQHGPTHEVEQYQGNCDGVVGVSEEVCAVLKGRGHTPTYILNPINLNRFFGWGQGEGILNLCKSKTAQEQVDQVLNELEVPHTNLHYDTNPTFEVEDLMRQHQIVIGYGRCIYEGLALGMDCFIYGTRLPGPEIVADGWVTEENIDTLIKKNCSGRTKKSPADLDELKLEMIFRPKPSQTPTSWQRKWAEANVDSETQSMKYLDLYEQLLPLQARRAEYA